MDTWKLPTTLRVGGKDYEIRTDYRAVLDILIAMNDPDIYAGMNEQEKRLVYDLITYITERKDEK